MTKDMENQVVLVAAGSKGLGFGVAEACAKKGANVVIGSRSQENIDAALEKLAAHGGTHHGALLDATSKDSIDAWVQTGLEKHGRIDGLLINAGGPPAGQFDDFDEQAWYDAFELTLMSAVRMIHAALPTMREQKKGSILTISSSSVKEPIDVLLLSNVMRSGVTSLAKSLSKSVAKDGIRVNNLVPGTIYTDRIVSLNNHRAEKAGKTSDEIKANAESLIPMGRYGKPEEFGEAGAFLLSDAASYISGATLMVDGALSRTVW